MLQILSTGSLLLTFEWDNFWSISTTCNMMNFFEIDTRNFEGLNVNRFYADTDHMQTLEFYYSKSNMTQKT